MNNLNFLKNNEQDYLGLKDGVFLKDCLDDIVEFICIFSSTSRINKLSDSEIKFINQAYRLRYEIYCDEYGFSSPYACNKSKNIVDSLDNNAFHILAIIDGIVVGCGRFNLSRNSELGCFEELLNMTKYSSHPKNTAISTKLIIKKDFRGHGIDRKIIDIMGTLACTFDIVNVFLDCRLELEKYYRKFGLLPCGEIFQHYETGKVIPMMINLLDFEYLLKINSPLINNLSIRKLNKIGL